MVLAACSREQESWVADAGCPRIGDHRHHAACQQFLNKLRKRLVLIKLVVAAHGSGNAEVLHQHATRARVFGEDDLGFFEHPDGAWRHVVEIPDGGGHDV